jgi:hypothetical protein
MRILYLTVPCSKNERANLRSVPLPETRELIRKFDRDTGLVATAVLAMVIFGAVVLAMQVKERDLKVEDNAVAFSKGVDNPAAR